MGEHMGKSIFTGNIFLKISQSALVGGQKDHKDMKEYVRRILRIQVDNMIRNSFICNE